VSFAATTLCVASHRVFIAVVIVYFVIDLVRKLLDTPSHLVKRTSYEALHYVVFSSLPPLPPSYEI
jgi:hypothetical protein